MRESFVEAYAVQVLVTDMAKEDTVMRMADCILGQDA